MAQLRDKSGRPIVVVTGMGVVTSLGAGKTDNWAKLTAGKSGIRAITRFSTENFKTRVAGTVDFVPVEPLSAPALAERLAELAVEEATRRICDRQPRQLPRPAVPRCRADRDRVAAAPGAGAGVAAPTTTSTMTIFFAPRRAGAFVIFTSASCSDRSATTWLKNSAPRGSPISLSTACASGASAIQLGLEAIRRGETEAALCVATDGSINPESLVRFSLLSALSTQNDPPEGASKPFSKNRDGFVMAEGAGALVLESYDARSARGAAILGVIEGCGELADSFHRTRSSPDGKPIIGCMRNAIIGRWARAGGHRLHQRARHRHARK